MPQIFIFSSDIRKYIAFRFDKYVIIKYFSITKLLGLETRVGHIIIFQFSLLTVRNINRTVRLIKFEAVREIAG